MKKNFAAIFFGVLLVLIGVASIGSIFDVWSWSDIFAYIGLIFFDGWYSLLLIIPCGIGLVKKGGKVLNLFGLIIGILILLTAQGVEISRNVLLSIIPALVVACGLSLIYTGFFGKKAKVLSKLAKGDCNTTAFFSSTNPKYINKEFNGGSCNAVFGSIDLDITQGYINNSCKINCFCLFAGVDIKLPPNVKAVVTTNCIFGGVDNNHEDNPDIAAPTVYISGFCFFGGVDVY